MEFGNMENYSYIQRKNMYTLYHIPARKEWGCTKELNRRLKRLGYTMDDVVETIEVSGFNRAAELEKKLNIQYGYGWNDSQDYRRVTKMGLNGAKKGGDTNVKTGVIYKAQQRSVEVRTGSTHSEETRQKMREKALGRVSARKGVTVSEETKLKMSEAKKRYWEQIKSKS